LCARVAYCTAAVGRSSSPLDVLEMLTFDDIAQSVKVASHLLAESRSDAFQALQFYRHSGGEGPSWRTAGIFLDISTDARLVLEALYLPKDDVCVFRIYRNNPLDVSFAAKRRLQADACRDLADRALVEFQRRLPATLPPQSRVPRSFGAGVAQRMLPVPPPVNLAKVAE